eukprot:scaffold951_cov277-Chaetoceros_neogracile.AAC.12
MGEDDKCRRDKDGRPKRKWKAFKKLFDLDVRDFYESHSEVETSSYLKPALTKPNHNLAVPECTRYEGRLGAVCVCLL